MQGTESCHGNLLIRKFLGMSVAWSDHIGLQQRAFQVDVVVTQSLIKNSQHLFSYVLTALQVMVPNREDFRLQNGHNAILLTSAGITGQNIGIFHHGEGRGAVLPSLQHTVTLGKVSSILLVLGAVLRQPIQPLGNNLPICSCQGYHTLIHLDAHTTTLGFDNLGEGTPIICLLLEYFMEEDDTPNAGIHAVIFSEQQLGAEVLVLLGVLSPNGPLTWQCFQWNHMQPGCPCLESQCAEQC